VHLKAGHSSDHKVIYMFSQGFGNQTSVPMPRRIAMTIPAGRSRGERISAAAAVKIGAAIAAATKEAGPIALRANSREELRSTM